MVMVLAGSISAGVGAGSWRAALVGEPAGGSWGGMGGVGWTDVGGGGTDPYGRRGLARLS